MLRKKTIRKQWKAHWEYFRDILKKGLTSRNKRSCANAWCQKWEIELFTKVLVSPYKEVCPLKKGKIQKPPWWNKNIENKVKEVRNVYIKALLYKEADGKVTKKEKRYLCYFIRRAKKDSWVTSMMLVGHQR